MAYRYTGLFLVRDRSAEGALPMLEGALCVLTVVC
jgi:hypothetical protein